MENINAEYEKLAKLEESLGSKSEGLPQVEAAIEQKKEPERPPEIPPPSLKPPTIDLAQRPAPFAVQNEEQEKRRQESLMHFAAIELEGTLKKKKH